MKRVDLIRHLASNGCVLLREGGNHSVYVNRSVKKSSSVPRHREINEFLAPEDLSGSRGSDAVALIPSRRAV